MNPSAHPRIFVNCLAAYNNGTFHGNWIYANNPHTIHAEINKILRSSPAHNPHQPSENEEWFITDYDNFGGINIAEHDTVEHILGITALITTHGDAFTAWASNIGTTHPAEYDPALHVGTYATAEDWAYTATEKLTEQLHTATHAWARNKNHHTRNTNWRDVKHAIEIDYNALVLIAEANWGWTFVNHHNKIFVFTS